MRLVVVTDEGTAAMNYIWLPTWIGMNNILLKEVGDHVFGRFKGAPLSESCLQHMHDEVAEQLCERLKMPSLMHLFDSMGKVEP